MPGMLGWVGLPGSLPLGLPSNLVNQLGNVTIIWIYMILYDIIWFILIYIYWFTYMLTKRPSIRCVQRNILQWMESWHHPPERRDQNTSDRPNQKIPDNRDFWMNLDCCQLTYRRGPSSDLQKSMFRGATGATGPRHHARGCRTHHRDTAWTWNSSSSSQHGWTWGCTGWQGRAYFTFAHFESLCSSFEKKETSWKLIQPTAVFWWLGIHGHREVRLMGGLSAATTKRQPIFRETHVATPLVRGAETGQFASA
jgi:hypothetical protein